MANFPTAAQARERGQGNRVITEEIAILELAVLDAITAGNLSTTYGGSLPDSTASTISFNGSTITASPMTQENATGQAYYTAWKGTTTDAPKVEQMKEVIDHFEAKGFTISRKSANTSTIYWEITW